MDASTNADRVRSRPHTCWLLENKCRSQGDAPLLQARHGNSEDVIRQSVLGVASALRCLYMHAPKKSEPVLKGGGGNGEGKVAPQDVLRLRAERTHGNARAMLA